MRQVSDFNSFLVASNLYAFDALSRPTTRTTGVTGVSPVDSTFVYNNRSEVVSATIGTNSFAHAYDDIGNHLLFGDNAVTNTYTHNNLNQIATSCCALASPRTIHHNADGGLSSDGIWTYAYDAEDQLTSVTSRSLTNGAIRVRNAYDYRRRRISKTVQRLNVTTASPPAPPVELREWETREERTFVYDGWNLIHETIYTIEGGATNTSEVQYFWGLDLSNSRQGAGGVGGLLAVSRNGQFYFPSFDNNGNVTKYIGESGNVVAAYEYDDFGRIIFQSGTLADFFRHRFSTKYYDNETGLYYYIKRFYHPIFKRWLTRDPINEQGGLNLCQFCRNAAVFGYDALGLLFDITYVQFDSFLGHGWIRLGSNQTYDIKDMIGETIMQGGKVYKVQSATALLPQGIGFYPASDVGFFDAVIGVKGRWRSEEEKEARAIFHKSELKEWDTNLKQGKVVLSYGLAKNKCCKNATKGDILSCLDEFKNQHADATYRLPFSSCRARASEALSACCLTVGNEIETKFGEITLTIEPIGGGK